MIPIKYHTFVDGQVDAGKITAERLNKNWDNLYDMFDPSVVGISEDNIASTAKILVSNRDYLGANKITGEFEFDTCPIFPDGSIDEDKINVVNFVVKSGGYIPDSDLSNNIPRKNGDEAISGAWSFNSIDPIIADVEELPAEIASGRILRYDGKLYVGKGSQWKELITEDALTAIEDTLANMVVWGVTPSSAYRNNNSSSHPTDSSTFVKLKETTINEAVSGELSLTVEARILTGSGQIYFAKNGTMLGETFDVPQSEDFVEYILPNQSITLSSGDKLQVWGKKVEGTPSLFVQNFSLRFNRAITTLGQHNLSSPLVTVEQSDLDATYNL